MKRLIATVGFVCSCLAVSSAEAATPRAYVSVNGSDANTCNVPATPCRTYTGAISQVTPGGEVIVLNSGTFGGGTISQSVTINAPLGVVALAATPVIVNPGAGNVVVLRGLTFQAAVPGIDTGITHVSGRLFVENTIVDGWDTGLYSSSTAQGLFVKGSVFRNNGSEGILVDTGSSASVAIDHSFFERNYYGLSLSGGSGRVSSTVMSGNNYGALAHAAGTEFTFQRCEVSGNTIGLYANSNSILRASRSTISGNGVGLWNETDTAVVESFSNNVIKGNAIDTNGIIAAVTLQ